MEAYIGSIAIFGGNFAPRGSQLCQGQLLSIASNTALFSILGTTYGGNGTTTFALPDLRGRIPIGWGQGPGLQNYVLGQVGGTETTTLLSTNMPAHVHPINPPALVAAPEAGSATAPAGNYLAASRGAATASYAASGTVVAMNSDSIAVTSGTIGDAGGSQPFSVLQPIMAINHIICTQGYFPSRN